MKMSTKLLISFLMVIHSTFVLCYTSGDQALASIKRLEKLHKAIEEETKILKIRAYSVFGESKESEDEFDETLQHTKVNGGNYVRWGRTTCPGTSWTIYNGYAGGSFYKHTGAAANYLCLPRDPQWSEKAMGEEKKQTSVAFVYGSEYLLSTENKGFFGDKIGPGGHEVPCTVCGVQRTNILMIPARTSCYDGWKREYTGYLVAGHRDHAAASEYICLDENPEATGAPRNENGKLFYLTVGKCGPLPCPPYVDGRLLSCVVCTK